MLDFGWSEAFLIVVLAVFLFGPEDIPKVMVAVGRVFRRLQYVKFALSQQFEDLMRDADLDDFRSSVNFEAKRFEKNTMSQFNEGDEDDHYFNGGHEKTTHIENEPKSEEVKNEPVV